MPGDGLLGDRHGHRDQPRAAVRAAAACSTRPPPQPAPTLSTHPANASHARPLPGARPSVARRAHKHEAAPRAVAGVYRCGLFLAGCPTSCERPVEHAVVDKARLIAPIVSCIAGFFGIISGICGFARFMGWTGRSRTVL